MEHVTGDRFVLPACNRSTSLQGASQIYNTHACVGHRLRPSTLRGSVTAYWRSWYTPRVLPRAYNTQ